MLCPRRTRLALHRLCLQEIDGTLVCTSTSIAYQFVKMRKMLRRPDSLPGSVGAGPPGAPVRPEAVPLVEPVLTPGYDVSPQRGATLGTGCVGRSSPCGALGVVAFGVPCCCDWPTSQSGARPVGEADDAVACCCPPAGAETEGRAGVEAGGLAGDAKRS